MSIPANIVSPPQNVMAQVRVGGRRLGGTKNAISSLDTTGARARLILGEYYWHDRILALILVYVVTTTQPIDLIVHMKTADSCCMIWQFVSNAPVTNRGIIGCDLPANPVSRFTFDTFHLNRCCVKLVTTQETHHVNY